MSEQIKNDECSHKWEHIPDSLAQFCMKCGDVRVSDWGGTKWEKGASIFEWVKDLADSKRKYN